MNTSERLGFIERLLKAVERDYCDDLWWRTFSDGECGGHDTDLHFFVNCNDVFAWGCADCEEVTPENVRVLEESIRDCENAFDGTAKHHGGGTVEHLCYGPMLFCCRVRETRPQGAVMKDFKNPKVLALFDAVGEKREAGTLDNPYGHPADGGRYEYIK